MFRGQEGCKNSLQKGDRFSVPLFTSVGARDAACGFGFGWAAGLVSVTVWLRFLLRVALVAVTAAETEFPLRSKWFPLHPAPHANNAWAEDDKYCPASNKSACNHHDTQFS